MALELSTRIIRRPPGGGGTVKGEWYRKQHRRGNVSIDRGNFNSPRGWSNTFGPGATVEHVNASRLGEFLREDELNDAARSFFGEGASATFCAFFLSGGALRVVNGGIRRCKYYNAESGDISDLEVLPLPHRANPSVQKDQCLETKCGILVQPGGALELEVDASWQRVTFTGFGDADVQYRRDRTLGNFHGSGRN